MLSRDCYNQKKAWSLIYNTFQDTKQYRWIIEKITISIQARYLEKQRYAMQSNKNIMLFIVGSMFICFVIINLAITFNEIRLYELPYCLTTDHTNIIVLSAIDHTITPQCTANSENLSLLSEKWG